MQNSYRSDFPNQVHQLNVSPSQHYYLLKDGTIKFQSKTLDINWQNYHDIKGSALATFIIRDHFSGCFYAEFHQIDSLPNIQEFLFNAWRKKENYAFHGMGREIIVPKSTFQMFPSLTNFFKNESRTSCQFPTSGFSSAIRSIREWEHNVQFLNSFSPETRNIIGFKANIEPINRMINDKFGRKNTAIANWLQNSPRIIPVENLEDFSNLFK